MAQKRVGIFFHPNGNDDAAAFAGCRDYIRTHTDWHLIPIADKSRIPQASTLSLGLDALLMGGWMTHRLERLPDLPICLWLRRDSTLPGVDADFRAAGRMAGEHLLSLGLSRFLYVHALDQWGTHLLLDGYADALRAVGHETKVLPEGPRVRRHGWNLQRQVADWADALPKLERPLGVLAFDEVHGERMQFACERAGLRIPDDLALIVSTTNAAFCDICDPPISCVMHSPFDLGYAAAAELHRLLDGRPGPAQELVPPTELLARPTTRAVFTTDAALRRAIMWMDAHEPVEWTVAALAEAAHCSRMTLFRRFRDQMNCSPVQFIQRRRVDLAREKLMVGSDPIISIALDCGFADSPHLSRQFRRRTGMSPGEYRAHHRSTKT